MKQIIILLIVLALGFNATAQTQAEMNQVAYDEYQKTDSILNGVYQDILSYYNEDTLFIANLKKSQRIWIEFRDAEMDMKYPDYPQGHYGSIQGMCRAQYLQKLTQERTETLKQWLRGAEEGDVCRGSVNIKLWADANENGNKLYIYEDGSALLSSSMRREHRIFGYKEMDTNSEKMLLLSVYTAEVKYNTYSCKYGAFYDTNGMDREGMELKYLETEGDFVRFELIKNGEPIDELYVLKEWVEFEK